MNRTQAHVREICHAPFMNAGESILWNEEQLTAWIFLWNPMDEMGKVYVRRVTWTHSFTPTDPNDVMMGVQDFRRDEPRELELLRGFWKKLRSRGYCIK